MQKKESGHWKTGHLKTERGTKRKTVKKARETYSAQSLSRVRLFVTPWTTARQASKSITNSQRPPRPMSIESVMPSNHLILCHPLLLLPSIFPSIRSFQMSQFFTSGGHSIGVSTSASVLPMNIQDWFPLGWTGCERVTGRKARGLQMEETGSASVRRFYLS